MVYGTKQKLDNSKTGVLESSAKELFQCRSKTPNGLQIFESCEVFWLHFVWETFFPTKSVQLLLHATICCYAAEDLFYQRNSW